MLGWLLLSEKPSATCFHRIPHTYKSILTPDSQGAPSKYDVEHVHLDTNKARVKEAEAAGVKSVPALVMNGAAFHINFGAGIDALK